MRFSLPPHTSCRASEWPYRGVTVLTEGSRVSQLLLLKLYLQKENRMDGDRTTSQGGFLLTCQTCMSMSSSLLCSFSHVKINLNCSVEIPFITWMWQDKLNPVQADKDRDYLKTIRCRATVTVLGNFLQVTTGDEALNVAWNMDHSALRLLMSSYSRSNHR